jgi:hypothetical protein
LSNGYGRLIRSERRSGKHPVLLQNVHEGAHLRQKQAAAQVLALVQERGRQAGLYSNDTSPINGSDEWSDYRLD